MFNENSAVVNSWVELIKSGVKNFNDVPDLSNLRTVVASVIDSDGLL